MIHLALLKRFDDSTFRRQGLEGLRAMSQLCLPLRSETGTRPFEAWFGLTRSCLASRMLIGFSKPRPFMRFPGSTFQERHEFRGFNSAKMIHVMMCLCTPYFGVQVSFRDFLSS